MEGLERSFRGNKRGHGGGPPSDRGTLCPTPVASSVERCEGWQDLRPQGRRDRDGLRVRHGRHVAVVAVRAAPGGRPGSAVRPGDPEPWWRNEQRAIRRGGAAST